MVSELLVQEPKLRQQIYLRNQNYKFESAKAKKLSQFKV